MEANNMFEMLPEGEAGEAEMDIEEEGLIREEFGQTEGSVGDKEISDKFGTEIYKSLIGKSSVVQVNVVLTDSNGVSKSCDGSSSAEAVENGLLTSEYLTSPSNCRRGVKRARLIDDEVQPSVHVSYSSLTRESKQKLEELMQLWSTWHAQHVSSLQSSIQVLESGEQTFFPALHVGKKQSHVMFWMDHQPSKVQGNGQIVLENDVPLYDRDYGLGLTLVDDPSNVEGGQKIIGDASRCFNCGGYSHSLKDCPRPRNNVAVTNARNVHMSKRNQTSASRISTRYYESAFAGKFKGLKPGTLDAETRKLLGLGELDPPPWHARMRELGYPPGYLVPEGDDEDKESGITIFADGESKAQDLEEKEDEESKTMRKANPKKPPPQLKKVVEFPGINGPVPKDADERKWIGPSNSSSDLIMQHGSHHRPPHQHQPPTMVEAAAAAACGSRTYSISYNDKHYRVSSFASYSRSREEENPPPPGTTESPVSLFHSPLERRYSSSSSFGFVGGYLRPDIHSPREDPLGLHRRSLLYDSTLPHSYPGSSRFWGSDHGRRDDDAAFRAEELSRPLEILHRDYMHGSPHY